MSEVRKTGLHRICGCNLIIVMLLLCFMMGIRPLKAEAATVTINSTPTDGKVLALPGAVVKGAYSTPIWKQHSIWGSSSAGNHGCGICVTAMALKLNGVVTNPNTVLKENNRSIAKCKSYSPKEARRYLKKKGVKVSIYRTTKLSRSMSCKIMKNALKNGKTVMLVTKGKPFSTGIHWVLLCGLRNNGKAVAANSSYGYHGVCKKNKRQYQVVAWKLINKSLIRNNKKWGYFLIVG